MGSFLKLAWAALVLFDAATMVGCGDPQKPADGPPAAGNGADAHHAETGPHGGVLIDLGHNHAFHAELVDEHDAETISIYILDKDLKEYPIGEPKITLALDIHGTSQTFELNAAQAVNGKTARFDAADSKLHEELEAHHDTSGKLRVTIEGTPYTGTLKREAKDNGKESHKDHKH